MSRYNLQVVDVYRRSEDSIGVVFKDYDGVIYYKGLFMTYDREYGEWYVDTITVENGKLTLYIYN